MDIKQSGGKSATKPKVSKAELAKAPDPDKPEAAEGQLSEEDVPVVKRLAFNSQTVVGLTALAVVVVVAAVAIGFRLMYMGKIYPGISAEGVYLGGLTKAEAVTLLTQQAAKLQGEQLVIVYGNSRLSVPVNQLGTKFDANAAATDAMAYGRTGWCWDCMLQKARVLLGRPTVRTAVSVDNSKLTPFIAPVAAAVEQPVANASLDYTDRAIVHPAQAGRRLDQGLLTLAILDRLGNGSTADIVAPVYNLNPAVDDAGLAAVEPQAAGYLTAPLQIQVGSGTRTVTQAQIVSWINVSRPVASTAASLSLTSFYPYPSTPALGLNRAAVAAYVAAIAQQTDQVPQDARLTIQDGKAVVFQPSRDGLSLDQPGAVKAITAAVTKPSDQRSVTLSVAVSKPVVTAESLNNLGIKELISEGVTTFPGSSDARLQNIRVGASKFNGVLVKPGEEFSFDDHMGDVDAANGYAPSLVIIGNKIETQYGGGMCQVSTTAYRAALQAGLPITARTNHAYAISWYAWPYGVPGVDATVYGPTVDMRFVNDTGSYILIQTIMSGDTLKFDFYGTKTKTGRINQPYFVSGNSDATQPSTTVFTRDVLDLNGNVLKTDTVTTHYQSSLDFEHIPNQLH